MNDNRNTPNWEEHKNQDPQNEVRGSKEETGSERPGNRLKDGTNDLQNGDENPASAKTGEESSDSDLSQAG